MKQILTGNFVISHVAALQSVNLGFVEGDVTDYMELKGLYPEKGFEETQLDDVFIPS